jgi:hypothetical protein
LRSAHRENGAGRAAVQEQCRAQQLEYDGLATVQPLIRGGLTTAAAEVMAEPGHWDGTTRSNEGSDAEFSIEGENEP